MRVWTDGSTVGNGLRGARGGIGVYFGEDDPRNVSLPFPPTRVDMFTDDDLGQFKDSGPPTNQRCELAAIFKCLSIIARDDSLRKGNVEVVSDSDYSIKCITTWSHSWILKGWKNAKGKPVANQDLIRPILSLSATFPDLTFTHVRAHTGGEDELSQGNKQADLLAVAGVNTCQASTSFPLPGSKNPPASCNLIEQAITNKRKIDAVTTAEIAAPPAKRLTSNNSALVNKKNAIVFVHEHIQKKKWKYTFTSTDSCTFPVSSPSDFGCIMKLYKNPVESPDTFAEFVVSGFPDKRSAREKIFQDCWDHILAADKLIAMEMITREMRGSNVSSAKESELNEQDLVDIKKLLRSMLAKRKEAEACISGRECTQFLQYHKTGKFKDKTVQSIKITFTDQNSSNFPSWACAAVLANGQIKTFSLKKIVWTSEI